VHFTRLRLTGFKSFVDPTELKIEPGLTGVVGPNGCGKSNLVEALRWVMGETSAKKMRGGEMDDVIFGGTAERPARNIAEVMLELDNSRRDAPAAFNDSEELEVARRIERGMGSVYKVNGKEVRARDVQLLFADQATGAHSTALVSQDRVGALISAKPAERRLLLEEAAGITGLHSRRHEAELRLKAAEANLTRLDDVLTALDTQLQNVKRQARQATRYRNIAGQIRWNEAAILYRRLAESRAGIVEAEEALSVAEGAVAELTTCAATAATAQAELAASLPALRQDEATAAAELQRLTLARGELDAEESRVAAAQAENRRRRDQVDADLARETAQIGDAEHALGRLAGERDALVASQAGEAEAQAKAVEALRAAEALAAERDAALTRLTEAVAAGEARRSALELRAGELAQRAARLGDKLDALRREAEALAAEETVYPELQAAIAEAERAERRLAEARAAAEAAERALAEARGAETGSAETARDALARRTRLHAEEQALVELLAVNEAGLWPPVIDAVTVDPGYEAALGAALGDDLSAPTDEAAPVHWRSLPPLADAPALPVGATPLSQHVRGPDALARRLDQIGVVADVAAGNALQGDLRPGQRLVSRDGALWRWDGYRRAADAATAAAMRLKQRNRLGELAVERAAADREVEQAETALAAAKALTQERVLKDRAARDSVSAAFSSVAAARERQAQLDRRAAAHSTRRTALADSLAAAEAELAETARERADVADQIAGLADLSAAREEIARRRVELAEMRTRVAEHKAAAERLHGEAEARRQRLESIDAERAAWMARLEGARTQLATLEERRAQASAELERLSALPEDIARRRHALMDRIGAAEGKRRQAADALAQAEERLAAADRTLKAAEHDLAQAREDRVRAEEHVAQARQAAGVVAERIREKFDCAPDDVLAAAGIAEGAELPDAAEAELKLERLVRERENMGPVNLRAEEEAAEMEQQIAGMRAEREDLVAAIARLRHGIGELNKEGRERLLASFEKVNAHFSELFTRLFGGGRAHLALIESDDPLQAGLEIMASPPGKKIGVLTQLSGGERALTAIALLFAVFLTNPAPICVLDEVDAPLDDANVERFCQLVSEIAHNTQTRFLVITHHRITMARMDRLFGVTMAEHGVSQLVSVDLQEAVRIRHAG
jgi:chromosome segregation protein